MRAFKATQSWRKPKLDKVRVAGKADLIRRRCFNRGKTLFKVGKCCAGSGRDVFAKVRLNRPGCLGHKSVGILAAVEFRKDGPFGAGLASTVGAEAERSGVFFRVIGDVLAIAPPYIATKSQLNWMMDVLVDSIQTATIDVQKAEPLIA